MIVFCIIAAAIYTAIMYYRNRRMDFPPLLTKIMAILRFASVFLISFLLLSPLLKSTSQTNEKPIIVFAQDNSQSIVIHKDSNFYRNDYKLKYQELINELSKDFDVRTFSFDDNIKESISTDYIGKQTDISLIFEEFITRYTNRNLGAVILASDGIYNKGSNPLYTASKIKAPVFTLALGDTVVRKDILIQKINYNRITYLGNTFPIQIIVNANKSKGQTAKLRVNKGTKEIFNKNINITSDAYSETVDLITEAKESGLQKYSISISPLENEITLSNNRKDIFIEVLDARQKILILAAAPHPDISALKQTLENNRNYDVQVALANEFTKSAADYNLIIMHQLPSVNNVMGKVFADIEKTNIPVLYILGTQSNITQFNAANTGLNIAAKNQAFNDALPYAVNEFPYFTVSDECKKMLNYFPPLTSFYGNYKTSPSAEPLLLQKIGNVVSNQPLIVFNQNMGGKSGIIAGEGLWRWKLANYAQKANTDAFDEIITKTIQYLAVRIEKGLFKVTVPAVFDENQQVEFDAELYNDSYELINEADVNLTISNSQGKKFTYQFNRTSNAYHLNAGIFPQGDYKYQAIVKLKNKTLTQNGSFSVTSLDIEYSNTVANHQLLYNLAKQSGGEMLYPSEIDKLKELIKAREDIKVVKYTQKKYNDLISLSWIFFLILALLSTEWFLRKRNGGY